MNNKEKYEKIKQEIRQTGGRCNYGSMLILAKMALYGTLMLTRKNYSTMLITIIQ